MPTILGKNQLEHASGAIPLLANGNEKAALLDAIRISAANWRVAPTPTAGPLHAAMIGFRLLYILRVKIPPESLLKFSSYVSVLSNSFLKVFSPEDRSAPAQNALPDPVIMIAFIESLWSQ